MSSSYSSRIQVTQITNDYFPSSLWENKDFSVSNLLFNLEFTKENSTNNYLGYTFEIVMKMHLILQ